MIRRVASLAAIIGIGLSISGCLATSDFERRANWRDDEERACMRNRQALAASWVEPTKEINDRGACGVDKPLKVKALSDGTISIGPIATIGCPMTVALEGWVQTAVQPAAMAWFGMPVTDIKQISAYYCRTRNSEKGAPLSEHAFGNALDIAGFTLIDGRQITVLKGWKGSEDERGFLREVFAHGCRQFKTALGPGVKFHDDHFHFDLAHHNDGGTSRYCRPQSEGEPPLRPPVGGMLTASWRPPVNQMPTTFGSVGPAPMAISPPMATQPPVYAQQPTYSAQPVYAPQMAAPSPFPQVQPQQAPLEFPEVQDSIGGLPDDTYWPRRLPPAEVPMSYAPR
jgi:hypothetical protein